MEQIELGVRVLPMPTNVWRAVTTGLRGLRHDAANALVVIYAACDLAIEGGGADARTGRMLQRIHGQVGVVRTLLDEAAGDAAWSEVSRTSNADELIADIEARVERAGACCQVAQARDELAELAGRFGMSALRGMLMPLVRNAMDAFEPGTNTPTISLTATCSGNTIQMQITDNGPGCVDIEGAANGRLRRPGGHLGIGLAGAATYAAAVGLELFIRSDGDTGFHAALIGRHR